MIGTVIRGRYRVDAVVGTGAFATVYRAQDERLEADVALKVLAENHSLDPDVRERFINEARRLRQAGGPSVVGVHDVGETERAQPFIVMELADRGDLSRRVAARRKEGRSVVPDDLAVVADALATALRTLHAHRVVHRDITPRNLLLRSAGGGGGARPDGPGLVGADERLLVGDLGLSKDLAQASGITAAVGTAGFSAPEQRLGSGIDERTDVYAASALLVWLITGRAPADDGSWPAAALGDWPAGVRDALAAGLASEPRDRPPTADAWHQALSLALAPVEPAPTAPLPPDPVGEVPSTAAGDDAGPGRRRTLLVALAFVALLVAGVGGAWTVGRDQGQARGTDVADIGSGQVRATARDGGLTISVEGPDALTVGEPATFTADVGTATSWVWIGPDGRLSPDAPSLEVDPGSAGSVLVTLVATDDVGRTARAVLRVRAEEP